MKLILLFSFTVLSASALDYKRDVMPIFKEKCYDCHSDNAKKVKGGLRFDDEENFLPATKYQEAEIKKSCNKNKLV